VTGRKPGEAGYAEAVRAAREAAGKDPGELAAALDVSYESYLDIESYDDEITSAVSFRNLVTLAFLVELDLRLLFGADDTVDVRGARRRRSHAPRRDSARAARERSRLGARGCDVRPGRLCRVNARWACRHRSSLWLRLATSLARDTPRRPSARSVAAEDLIRSHIALLAPRSGPAGLSTHNRAAKPLAVVIRDNKKGP